MSKCCWTNGADRLAPCRVARKVQLGKNTVSVKGNNVSVPVQTVPQNHYSSSATASFQMSYLKRVYGYLGLNFLICKMGGNCSYFIG